MSLLGLVHRLEGHGAGHAFQDRSVVVTGGSRGLGFAMARCFAERGANVAICARDADTLATAEREIRLAGPGRVLAVPADVSDRGQVAELVDRVADEFGGIDVLVNNAGNIQVGPIEVQTEEDFAEAMNVMFWGVLRPTIAALPHLRRARGRVANITSIGGKVSVPHLVPYCSAKFAAVGFSEGLSSEVARHGISVTTVVPGLMRTGSHLEAMFKGRNREEFAWFSLGATLPLVSMDAERAARRILDAVAARRREIVLTPQAKLLVRAHGLAPATTSRVLSLVARALPGAGGAGDGRLPGKASRGLEPAPLTVLGDRAADDLQRHAG